MPTDDDSKRYSLAQLAIDFAAISQNYIVFTFGAAAVPALANNSIYSDVYRGAQLAKVVADNCPAGIPSYMNRAGTAQIAVHRMPSSQINRLWLQVVVHQSVMVR